MKKTKNIIFHHMQNYLFLTLVCYYNNSDIFPKLKFYHSKLLQQNLELFGILLTIILICCTYHLLPKEPLSSCSRTKAC